MNGSGDDDKKPPARKPMSETIEDGEESQGEDRTERPEPSTAANTTKDMQPSSGGAKLAEIISSSARTPQDVLCGRGMPFQSYPGNVTMHGLVGEHRDEYMSSKRSQKPLVIKTIIQKLKDSGARFLKPHGEFHSNEDDQWVEVDEQYIYDKISHVMRHRQRAARSETSSSDSAKTDTKSALDKGVANAPAAIAAATFSTGAGVSADSGAAHNQALLARAAGAGQLQALAAGGLNAAMAQQQQPTTTQSLLASLAGVQNRDATLRALLSTGQQPSLLSGMGLLGQPPPSSLLLGQNLMGAHHEQQQQQLLSLLGLQTPFQQASLDHSILARLRQNQLLGGIESHRLLAGAGLQPPQAQPSSLLNVFVDDELRRRALQSLAQSQDQPKSAEEGKEEEKK